MRTFLANLVPQNAPFGVAADVVLRGQFGAQAGAQPVPGQGGEALVERAEVTDALFVLGADEPADDRLVIDHGVEPPAGVVGFKGAAGLAGLDMALFDPLHQRGQPQCQCFTARLTPGAPAAQAVFCAQDGLALLDKPVE